MGRKGSYFLDESFSHRLVDPLSSSGPIPSAGNRMRWQCEVDHCIITIALMWWLSVRETPTIVIVFLYTSIIVFLHTFQSYVVSLYIHWVDIMFLNNFSLYCTCFKLLYIEMSSVKYSWVEKSQGKCFFQNLFKPMYCLAFQLAYTYF